MSDAVDTFVQYVSNHAWVIQASEECSSRMRDRLARIRILGSLQYINSRFCGGRSLSDV